MMLADCVACAEQHPTEVDWLILMVSTGAQNSNSNLAPQSKQSLSKKLLMSIWNARLHKRAEKDDTPQRTAKFMVQRNPLQEGSFWGKKKLSRLMPCMQASCCSCWRLFNVYFVSIWMPINHYAKIIFCIMPSILFTLNGIHGWS